MLHNFSDDMFDIIILAGQSNAEGTGFGDTENPYIPSDRVFYLNNDFTISVATEAVSENDIQGNFALPFARRYIDDGLLEDGRKLLIVRAAVGGTGFSDKHWRLCDDHYLRMLDMVDTALKLNPNNRLTALLWHQGETDAINNVAYDVHYRNLTELVKSVRKTFSIPELPFVAGDFVLEWKQANIKSAAPISDAVRAVCSDCGCAEFVATDGLISNRTELKRDPKGWFDNIHFSRKSLYILGERYFECFLKLRK